MDEANKLTAGQGKVGEAEPEKARASSWNSPIRSRSDALKMVKETTSVVFVLAFIQGALGMWLDASLLLDAAMYVLGGFFVRRFHSRAAAILLVFLALGVGGTTVANRLGMDLGGGGNIYLAAILLWAAVRSLEATWKLNGKFSGEEPNHPTPAWVTVVSGGALVAVLSLIGFEVMAQVGVIPDTAVVTGDEISDRVSHFLLDQGMIDADERVVLYYSAALFSFKKDGSFLTNRRVGSYEEIDGDLWFSTLRYEEIEEVEVEDPGGRMVEASVAIYDNQGEGFRLYMPAEADGLKRFLDTLEDFRRPVLPLGCSATARLRGTC